jgi:hypothetical protein
MAQSEFYRLITGRSVTEEDIISQWREMQEGLDRDNGSQVALNLEVLTGVISIMLYETGVYENLIPACKRALPSQIESWKKNGTIEEYISPPSSMRLMRKDRGPWYRVK